MRIGKAVKMAVNGARDRKDPLCVKLANGPLRYATPSRERKRESVDEALRETISRLVDGKLPWPLYLHGEVGSGKTCAVLCMVDLYGGWYTTLPELAFDIKDAMFGRLQNSSGYTRGVREIWKEWEKANLVILDEIATKNVTPHHYETLKYAIDWRHQKPAVFISNQNLESIDRLYDDRIASRLGEGTVCELEGDRRA